MKIIKYLGIYALGCALIFLLSAAMGHLSLPLSPISAAYGILTLLLMGYTVYRRSWPEAGAMAVIFSVWAVNWLSFKQADGGFQWDIASGSVWFLVQAGLIVAIHGIGILFERHGRLMWIFAAISALMAVFGAVVYSNIGGTVLDSRVHGDWLLRYNFLYLALITIAGMCDAQKSPESPRDKEFISQEAVEEFHDAA